MSISKIGIAPGDRPLLGGWPRWIAFSLVTHTGLGLAILWSYGQQPPQVRPEAAPLAVMLVPQAETTPPTESKAIAPPTPGTVMAVRSGGMASSPAPAAQVPNVTRSELASSVKSTVQAAGITTGKTAIAPKTSPIHHFAQAVKTIIAPQSPPAATVATKPAVTPIAPPPQPTARSGDKTTAKTNEKAIPKTVTAPTSQRGAAVKVPAIASPSLGKATLGGNGGTTSPSKTLDQGNGKGDRGNGFGETGGEKGTGNPGPAIAATTKPTVKAEPAPVAPPKPTPVSKPAPVRCAVNCAPSYPQQLKGSGVKGSPVVQVQINQGKVSNVQVKKSSGNADLDRAAVSAVENMQFSGGDGGDRNIKINFESEY